MLISHFYHLPSCQLCVAAWERGSAHASSLSLQDAWGLFPLAVVRSELLSLLQVLEETLSPMWNELLLFDQLIIDGKKEELKTETPIVIINLFSHNKFVSVVSMTGKAEELCVGAVSGHLGATSLFGFHDSVYSGPPMAMGPGGCG